jgi:universal stress protein E
MQRFKRILFVADGAPGEEAALRRAIGLARDNGATLTVTEVVAAPPPRLPLFSGEFTPKKLRSLLSEEGRASLERLTAALSGEEVKIKTRVLMGASFVAVVREVLNGKHDLVIKAAEEEQSASALLFGSTDLHLLRKCPCPVWILKSTRAKRYSRILAAVDPGTDDKRARGLDRRILDLAVSLALLEDSELDIVHVWSLYAERALRSRNVLPQTEIDRLEAQTRDYHRDRLDALLAHYSLDEIKSQVHLIKGEPGAVIPHLAQERRIELIVMGTVARTGIPGVFIGNTAERVLSSVDCSVLAVKPKGFATPIEPAD